MTTGTTANGRRNLLDLDDFSRREIEELIQNTESMKEIKTRKVILNGGGVLPP